MYTTLRGIPGIGTRSDPNRDSSADVLSDPGLGVVDPGDAGPPSPVAPPGAGRPRLARIVVTLGLVSFFTDLSSEMVVAVLPVYLTLVLGLTPIQYGLIDGLYQGVTAAVRIVGGIAADLTRRPKAVAVIGYGLSCVCKLFFVPAHSFAAVSGLVALDRTGKGLRTAPRDAMIAESAEPAALGYSFGVHRAMDTAGALGGPLIAFGVLALLMDAYTAIFVLSFSLAAVGVAVLVLFVPGRSPSSSDRSARKGALRRTIREFRGLLRGSAYRRLLAVGAMLSLVTISDGFIYLTLRERVGIGAALFPLLFVGTAAAYLVLAIPFGRLADRVGRSRVFLGGHLLAVLGYLALWLLPPGPALVVGVVALVGGYYAATDGVLPALTAPLVPLGVRASGIAGVQTVMAVGSMASAALFGTVWSKLGLQTAVSLFALALTGAILLAVRLLAGLPGAPEDATR